MYSRLQGIWDDLLEAGVVENLPSFIPGLVFNFQNGLESVGQKIEATVSHMNSCTFFFPLGPLHQVQHGIMPLSWFLLKSGTFSN